MANREFESLKEEILEALRRLQTLAEQSLNLFGHSEVSERSIQLVSYIEEKVHVLNELFKEPSSNESELLQNLFFHVKELREKHIENLKLDPQKLEFQRAFTEAIEAMMHDMHTIE